MEQRTNSLILAKIHMVTKPNFKSSSSRPSLILAKIHMVTKRINALPVRAYWSYSSKNPYGNKTYQDTLLVSLKSYSSKNPYGNKTILIIECI